MVITEEYFQQLRQRQYASRQEFQQQGKIPILDTKKIISSLLKTYVQQEEPIEDLLDRVADQLFGFWLQGCKLDAVGVDMVKQLDDLADKQVISQELKIILRELWFAEDMIFSCAAYAQNNTIANSLKRRCKQVAHKPYFLTSQFAIYGWYYAWQYIINKTNNDLEKAMIYIYLAKLESIQDKHYEDYFQAQQHSIHKTSGCMALSMWLQSAVIAYITNNVPLVEAGKIIMNKETRLELFHSVLDSYLRKAKEYRAFKGRYKDDNGIYQYYGNAEKFYRKNHNTRNRLKNNSDNRYINPKNKVYQELLRDINRNIDIGLKIIKIDDKLVVAQSVSAESVYHRGKNFK